MTHEQQISWETRPNFHDINCRSSSREKKKNRRMSVLDDALQQRFVSALQALAAARHVRDDDIPCQIEEGLYVGSVGAALNKEALRRLNITHILVAAKSLNPAYPTDFKYKKIEVLDSPDADLAKHFNECFEFIEEGQRTGGNVLVHCFAGRSRSITIVVAYLMKKHHITLDEALKLVKSKRPQASPNFGFVIQLTNFEKSLRGEQQLGIVQEDIAL